MANNPTMPCPTHEEDDKITNIFEHLLNDLLPTNDFLLTGESVLAAKHPRDVVLSGPTTIQGSATMVVFTVSIHSAIEKIRVYAYDSTDHNGERKGDINLLISIKGKPHQRDIPPSDPHITNLTNFTLDLTATAI